MSELFRLLIIVSPSVIFSYINIIMTQYSNPEKVSSKSADSEDQTIFLQPTGHKKHHPLIISGCSGVGKGTIVQYLLHKYPNIFELSVSYTTRKPRVGQQHGRQYFFVDKATFDSEAEKGAFVQYGPVHDNFYATHKSELHRISEKGKICILEIDLVAAQKIYAEHPEYHFLFLDAPNIETLKQRMESRKTQTEASLKRRLQNAEEELEKIKTLPFYNRILNKYLPKTKEQIVKFVNTRYGLELPNY